MSKAGLSFENEVFVAFAWYGLLSVLKMMLFSAYISSTRVITKTFANEEDVKSFGSSILFKGKQAVGSHPAIERARRAHLNDIENIIPFFLVGLIFVLSNPELQTALLYFRVFFGARVAHSISYVFKLPQPSRFICCAVGYLATVGMASIVISQICYNPVK